MKVIGLMHCLLPLELRPLLPQQFLDCIDFCVGL